MLFPKKVKYRKWQRLRGHETRVASRGMTLTFGGFGIRTLEPGEITARQIESARKVLTRYIQKGGRMWIRIFPDKPITRKPPEVGMGKGKGDPAFYVAPVEPGRVLFEIDGILRENALEALRKVGSKLPVKSKIIIR